MKMISIGDIFTEQELTQGAEIMASQGDTLSVAQRIDEEVVSPILARIDEKTGQKNHARYWAYALIHVITEYAAHMEKSEDPNFTNEVFSVHDHSAATRH
jgi:hypothetical protein